MNYQPRASGLWTEENVTITITMWEGGGSAGEIARRLGPGVTRNQVCGKLNRIGLSRRPRAHVHPKTTVRNGKTSSLAREYAIPGVSSGVGAVPRRPRIKRPPPPPSPPPGVYADLFTLTGCKWPVNDGGPFLFCNGARDFEQSYCAYHKHQSIHPGWR